MYEIILQMKYNEIPIKFVTILAFEPHNTTSSLYVSETVITKQTYNPLDVNQL